MLKDCLVLTDITEEVFYIDTSKVNYFKITEQEFIRVDTGGIKEKVWALYFQFQDKSEIIDVIITEEEFKKLMRQMENYLKGDYAHESN